MVSEFNDKPKSMYIHYTNEFDTLTLEQVVWQPYGGRDYFGQCYEFELNPKCMEEDRLWMMRCPLICLWVVEYHLSDRVMSHFVLYQTYLPKYKDTNISLHELYRKR